MDIEIHKQFKTALENMEVAWSKYSELKGSKYRITKMEKILLAKLTIGFIQQGMAVNKAVLAAEASEEYTNFVQSAKEIISQEEHWYMKKELAVSDFERVRSECSLQKRKDQYLGEER